MLKTLTELNSMTKAQIISSLTQGMTETVCTKSENGKFGQVSSEHVTRDSTGTIVKTEQWSWTYYKTGEVDIITQVVLDAKGSETSRKQIKNYPDGRQPEIINTVKEIIAK
jgi:hypothetical protein